MSSEVKVLPKLSAIQLVILFSLEGPQRKAQEEDPTKGWYRRNSLLEDCFRSYEVYPNEETIDLVVAGVLEIPAPGQPFTHPDDVRISSWALAQWSRVKQQAKQIKEWPAKREYRPDTPRVSVDDFDPAKALADDDGADTQAKAKGRGGRPKEADGLSQLDRVRQAVGMAGKDKKAAESIARLSGQGEE